MYLSRKFISAGTDKCTLTHSVAAPYLRKTIAIDSNLEKAELSVCGLGFYRFWLNGKELTKGFLSPYISNPDDIMDYDTYDLTGKLLKGKNVLAFQLGNGMQNAFGGYVWDFNLADFRSAPKIAFCIELTDKDGTSQKIEADESVLCADSPVTYDDLRQGECYDARNETEGWNLIDFDDSSWHKAISVETPRGKSADCMAKPIVATGEIKPVLIRRTHMHPNETDVHEDGWLYDFGVNCAGVCRLSIDGKAGQKITMTFGEQLDRNGDFYIDNIRFVREDYRNMPLYIQRDEYTCKGEKNESYTPSFTYHGFRYVMVTGITDEQATKGLLTYVVMNTELDESGSFSCSDETLNALQTMTRRSTLANFYHFPTDCPHREKNGWTADAALSTEQALLNFNPEVNYHEWSRHICAAMDERGALPGIVPTGGWGFQWGNGPAWDSVLLALPYMVYRYTGNKQIVEECLTPLFRYVNYLTTRRDDKGLIAIGLGDWCPPTGTPLSPLIFTDSVISMLIAYKTAFLFEQTGKTMQADFCRSVGDSFKAAIRKNLIDFDTMTAVGCCQTSQAMSIYCNVFTEQEKPKAFAVLLDIIKKDNDHLTTGVLGARTIFHVLSDFGEADLAYKIMVEPTAPSYGNWVARGETALPEDFTDKPELSCSLNHHFFGDISAWFYKAICGINLNPAADDLHRVDIRPHFIMALTHAEAYHNAPDGKIASSWVRDGDRIILTLEIPESMHGTFTADSGWCFEKDGSTHTNAVSGKYVLLRK